MFKKSQHKDKYDVTMWISKIHYIVIYIETNLWNNSNLIQLLLIQIIFNLNYNKKDFVTATFRQK